jgi:predicted DNA-binding antitoxin AbrB/MazE fold protein
MSKREAYESWDSLPGDQSMTIPVEAVYENGVLRPLIPLTLPEGQRVQVFVTSEEAPQGQNAALILAEIAAMPIETPAIPSTSRDHDQVLYGTPSQP